MSKLEAIAIVRAKYPRAIVVPDYLGLWSMMFVDMLSPKSCRVGTCGTAEDTWVGFANDILNGADW